MNHLSLPLTAETTKRLELVHSCFVPSPQTAAVEKRIHRLRQTGCLGKRGGHANCLLLVGPSGVGKSALVERYASQFPPSPGGEADKVPVIAIELSSAATPKSVVEALLTKLKDPFPGRGTLPTLTARFEALARKCGVELIILDEVQHLGKRDRQAASDYVKELLNLQICPILLVGTPEAEQTFTQDIQLVRRSRGTAHLHPYDWHDRDERKIFRTILRAFETSMGLQTPADLWSTDMAVRFHSFSGGIMGLVIKLLEAVMDEVIIGGHPTITREMLAEAAEEYRLSSDPNWINPFLAEQVEPAMPGVPNLMALAANDQPSPKTRLRGTARSASKAA